MNQAAWAFEADSGHGAADRERKIEKLHAKIGQLIVERDLYERFREARAALDRVGLGVCTENPIRI